MRSFAVPDQDRWLFFLQYHHLITDHVALETLLQEAQAYLLGCAAQLPASVPYRNFVAQSRFGVDREEHEAFFRKMLSDVDAPTAPFDLLNVLGDGSDVEGARADLDAHLSRRIRAQVRAAGVSAASLFHLAWALVLARVSDREDVVFGTVLFGRMHGAENVDRALGMFINTLPVRLRV
ncbi:condensation domain-containing protein, partial [Methylosinus sp. Sm6]|uniref:condensation domain-containing protein n=1 Tax=Methylosinus sp. Sm6 TaxID=2866948 RepID=UPI00272E881E